MIGKTEPWLWWWCSGDSLGIRPDELDERQRDQRQAAGREPRDGQCIGLHFLPGEERTEDGRPEDGAEDRSEQDVGDSARTPLGWIHVARSGADEERDAA